MKTILASLLVSISLLSPAFSDTQTSLDSKEECQTPAKILSEARSHNWTLDNEFKNVTEESNTYSSIQVFSNKSSPDTRLVIWYVDGCVDDINQVTDEFLQGYINQYVH